jgi:hypothetical protein
MRRSLVAIAGVAVLAGAFVVGRAWLHHRFPPPPNYRFGTGVRQESGTRGNANVAFGDAAGTALVVWSNHDGHALSDMHWEHGILILSGEVPAEDGPAAFRCEVPDSHTGTMAIDGASYDLARGTVFLVSADRRTRRVTQLDAPAARLQPGATNDSVFEELKKDPRIRSFVASGSSTRPVRPTTRLGT